MKLFNILTIERGIPNDLKSFISLEEAIVELKQLLQEKNHIYNENIFVYIYKFHEIHLMFSELKLE